MSRLLKTITTFAFALSLFTGVVSPNFINKASAESCNAKIFKWGDYYSPTSANWDWDGGNVMHENPMSVAGTNLNVTYSKNIVGSLDGQFSKVNNWKPIFKPHTAFGQKSTTDANANYSEHTLTFSEPVKNIAFVLIDVDIDPHKEYARAEITDVDGNLYELQPSDYIAQGQTIEVLDGKNFFAASNASKDKNIAIKPLNRLISSIKIINKSTREKSNGTMASAAGPTAFGLSDLSFCIPEYTLSFEENGGTEVTDQADIAYNGIGTVPVAPTKSGSTFVGWYTDNTYTTPFDFTTPITGDVIAYAKWNQNPIATDDTKTTTAVTPVEIDVTTNDTTSGTFDLATITITEVAQHGTLTVNANGTVTYTPNAGHIGADTFKYTVKDNNGVISNEATVTITVNPFEATKTSTKSGDFTRNNCGADFAGSTETYTSPEQTATETSTVSQADADEKAQQAADQKAQANVDANGQNYANTNGTCTQVKFHATKSYTATETVQRNNCPVNYTGTSVVVAVTKTATATSLVNQADADAKALEQATNEANTELQNTKQAKANADGQCTQTTFEATKTSTKTGDFTRNNCPANYEGSTVTYTTPEQTATATGVTQAEADTTAQQAADAKAEADLNANGQHYANTNGTCTSNFKPVINANNRTITKGDNLNLLDLVTTATDHEDGDVKAKVTVKNNGGFDNNTIGTYTVVFTVTDTAGNTTDKTVTVTVRKPTSGSATFIPVDVMIGTCSVEKQMCQRRYPVQDTSVGDDTAYKTYEQCLKTTTKKVECAKQWAKARGFTLCDSDTACRVNKPTENSTEEKETKTEEPKKPETKETEKKKIEILKPQPKEEKETPKMCKEVIQRTCPIFTQHMMLGDRDGYKGQQPQASGVSPIINQVSLLQKHLKKQGLYAGAVNGVFDKNTDTAVRNWQARHFNNVLAPWGLKRPTGRFYQSSERWMNIILGCNDAVTLDTGKFLPKVSDNEILPYAKNTCEVEEEIVTPKKSCPIFTQHMVIGDRDGYKGQERQAVGVSNIIQEVRLLQKHLKLQGMYEGAETGVFDKNTDTAVRKWQMKHYNTVLKPWGLKRATGRFYQSSERWMNTVLGCEDSVTLDNGTYLPAE
ncbi:hypothetical protein CSB37_03115 [bacterium DOLZORAL124_38_8]|nr:MAG: hypothetical protein CSB37_03115 [bacterium DOLZORAL124_38_8]